MLDESILWRKKLLLSFPFFSSKFIFSTLTSCLFGFFFNGADIKWTRFLFSIKGPTFCVPRFGPPLFFSLSPLAKTVVHQRYVVANVKKTTILVSWYWFIGQSNKEQSKKRGTRGLTQMVPSITTQQYCHSKKNLNIIAVEVSSILFCSKHASHFISISFARTVQRTMSNDKLQLQLQQRPCWFYYQFQLPKTIAVLFTGWLLPPLLCSYNHLSVPRFRKELLKTI